MSGGRYCKQCWYDLKGVESYNCPECGREFNPELPSTYRTSIPKGWPYQFYLVLVAQPTLIALVALVIVWPSLVGGSLVLGCMFIFFVGMLQLGLCYFGWIYAFTGYPNVSPFRKNIYVAVMVSPVAVLLLSFAAMIIRVNM